MFKRSLISITVSLGAFLLLWGCSKSSHDTLAFVGDESDMKTCYQIYPEDYFPTTISQDVRDGLFPPDLTGEYEMIHATYEGTYAMYNQQSHQYEPYPQAVYDNLSRVRSMYIVVEDQINGMAKIRFSLKMNDNFGYVDWYEADAYIYGNVYSDKKNDFVLFYENTENAGSAIYYRGNIIKGIVDSLGIHNINYWSIIKDRSFESEFPGLQMQYGFEHAHHNLAIRKE